MASKKNIIQIGNIEIEQLEIPEEYLNPQYPALIKKENGQYGNTELILKIDDLETQATLNICGLPKNKVVFDNESFPGLQKYLQDKNLCVDLNERIKCDQGIFNVVDITNFQKIIDLTDFFN